jgi:ABC-2 type transport system ATP-binding protein
MFPGKPIIEIKGLKRRFEKNWALQGIELQIEKGELFGIVGADGSGKTTLLQSICAILDPTEGSITVNGFDSVEDAPFITSRLGYMSQAYTLYGDLTVEENLEFFAKIREVPEASFTERKEKLLEFSGLTPFLKRRTKHLSGGMQKKLALCSNLVHEPDILILDEPTLGVDPISRRQLWDIIREYHDRGKTIIVATSYMDEAARCERVAFLLEGKVIACDVPKRLVDRLEDLFFTHIQKISPVGMDVPFLRKEGQDVLVDVKGLVRRFDGFTAVDNVSFDVSRGEIFGFVGPNGSGKTTTIKILCGIIPPTSGEVTVVGVNVSNKPEGVKGKIGYMSQKFSLYMDLTVTENISFFGRVYGLTWDELEKRKRWILEMAGLKEKENMITNDLSGAFRQRLALGCALIHHPDIVFLDEPTSGVDPVSRQSFWEMIKTLAGMGTSIFVTTHYIDEVENCDRVAFLHKGRALAIENSAKLKVQYGMHSMEDIFIRMVREADE